jgi:hypothetical protein
MVASEIILCRVVPELATLCAAPWLWLQPRLVARLRDRACAVGLTHAGAGCVVVAADDAAAQAIARWRETGETTPGALDAGDAAADAGDWAVLDFRRAAIAVRPNYLRQYNSRGGPARVCDAALVAAMHRVTATGLSREKAWAALERVAVGTIKRARAFDLLAAPASAEPADVRLVNAAALGLIELALADSRLPSLLRACLVQAHGVAKSVDHENKPAPRANLHDVRGRASVRAGARATPLRRGLLAP